MDFQGAAPAVLGESTPPKPEVDVLSRAASGVLDATPAAPLLATWVGLPLDTRATPGPTSSPAPLDAWAATRTDSTSLLLAQGLGSVPAPGGGGVGSAGWFPGHSPVMGGCGGAWFVVMMQVRLTHLSDTCNHASPA